MVLVCSQKEGNGKCPHGFALSDMTIWFTSGMIHHRMETGNDEVLGRTYAYDSRIVRYLWSWRLILVWSLNDVEMRDIVTAEDYVFVDMIAGGNLVPRRVRAGLAAFSTIRSDFFEGNRGRI